MFRNPIDPDSAQAKQSEDRYQVLSTTETTQTSLTKPGEIFSPNYKGFQKLSVDLLEEKLKSLEFPEENLENGKPENLESFNAEDSSESLNQALYNFLIKIKLECLYEILTHNGYDDLSFLIEQMKTEPLNEEVLIKLGVSKIGHRLIFLAFLEEETNKYFRRSFPIKSDCCFPEGSSEVPSLEEWLERLYLKETYELFSNEGLQDLKQILFIMNSSYKITEEVLKQIGIKKIGHRQRILFKLREDAQKLNKKDFCVNYEVSGINLACGKCQIF
jgi:hypothetical protein